MSEEDTEIVGHRRRRLRQVQVTHPSTSQMLREMDLKAMATCPGRKPQKYAL